MSQPHDEPPAPVPGEGSDDAVDRAAILRRRSIFIESVVTGLGLLSGCGDEAAAPQPCLEIAPVVTQTAAASASATAAADPTAPPSSSAPTASASASAATASAPTATAVPRPCLEMTLPPSATTKPAACLRFAYPPKK